MINKIGISILLVTVACSPKSENKKAPSGMVWIAGGEFVMGSDHPRASPAEGPAHSVKVNGFWIDETEVTNAQFEKFVEATGYITTAERPIDWSELQKQLPPGTPKPPDSLLVPGSLVFIPPDRSVMDFNDPGQWWRWVPGASWKHPEGAGSNIRGRKDHPVVHVSYEDAMAYATWTGKTLPTEAQWEFAARGGKTLERDGYTLPVKQGNYQANFFQGAFPVKNTLDDGFEKTSPVKSFPPNPVGLYDMIGNVWEWCSDWYDFAEYGKLVAAGQLAVDPEGPERCFDPSDPYGYKRVIRGGSFLCSEEYCSNYRSSSRIAAAFDTGQSHIGFRCIKSPTEEDL